MQVYPDLATTASILYYSGCILLIGCSHSFMNSVHLFYGFLAHGLAHCTVGHSRVRSAPHLRQANRQQPTCDMSIY